MSKKIVFILGSMAGGGAERVISNLSEFYSNQNYKITIITLLNDKVDYPLPKNTAVKYVPLKKKNIVNYMRWLICIKRLIRSEQPDFLISFFAKINILTLFATASMKIPIYVSERNDPHKDGRGVLTRILTYLFYPLSEGVIFQTKHAQSSFPKYIRNKSVIIPNPLNIDFDTTKPKETSKRIIAVGKLMRQKNHRLLIEAFDLIKDQFPFYSLHIYGEGELRNELQTLINNKNLQNRVYLPGRKSDIFKYIYNSELFILSSNYEGMSNALLEAMALRTPIITTNVAGSKELIEDYITGRIVRSNDVNALANAIEYMLNNKGQAREMAEKAKKQCELHNLNDICLLWDNYIQK